MVATAFAQGGSTAGGSGQASSAGGSMATGSSGGAGAQVGSNALLPTAQQQLYNAGAQSSSSGSQSGSTSGQNPYNGSLIEGKATGSTIDLSLEDAVHRGLRNNLGVILQDQNQQTANGQRLEQLQTLLPTITGDASIAVQQVNLAAYGLKFPGLNPIIGPFQVVDFRASLTYSLFNLQSLENYMQAKHNFRSARLSAEDARDMVVLTVGNAYLICVADGSRIDAVQAELATSKVTLDQAVASHDAGVSPRDRMTQAEFHRAYEGTPEHFRAELIGGIVYVASPLRLRHGRNHVPLGSVLFAYEDATPGTEHGDNTTVILGEDAEPQPDLFLRVLPANGGRSRTTDDDYVGGAPELVAEIAHASRAIDLHAKRADYAAAGVPEYLVYLVDDLRLRWFDLAENRELLIPADGIVRSRQFPGLWIDTAALAARSHARLMATLALGLATQEHAEFVRLLAQPTGRRMITGAVATAAFDGEREGTTC